MITNDQKLILRYVAQNTTKGEKSDVHIYELESINTLSWDAVIQCFNTLKKRGFITGTTAKNSFLELTDAGWKEHEASDKITDKVKLSNTTPKVKAKSNEVFRFAFKFDGSDPVKWANVKTGLFKNATDIVIIGEVPMTPAQETWLANYTNKISNWSEYPRKIIK